MRFGRTSKAASVAAIAALALSACASGGGSGDTSSSGSANASGGEVTVVETNAFSSFNTNTADGNTDINAKITYATASQFNYIDNELNIVKNEKFGKYEKLSDDPLTVKYTINDGVKWSDGEPVTADDMMLAWAIDSGHYDDATLKPDGSVKSGSTYFEYAGSTEGMGLTDLPEIGDDNHSMTVKYSKPYADWEIALTMDKPAHVVAKKAGLADAAALTKLFQDTPKGDPANPTKKPLPKLAKVAKFWNTGYDTKSMPSDKSLYVSDGPFIADSITPEQSMTLVRNKDYDWGPIPNVDSITVRYIGEAPAQVQALKNGEVDIIAPQPSADTLKQVKGLSGVKVDTGEQLAYDHIDLNFNGPFKDKDVREAFMKTVPRQAIVNSIVKPLDPNAKPLDSQIFVPAQDGYAETIKNNGSAAFQKADVAGAKKLLNGKTPTVRIMYNKDNPNRVDAFTLISESARQAGFKIKNDGLGSSDWGAALGNGTYDATIFGWTNPGVGVTGVPQLFSSGSASNFSKFNSPEVDKLAKELIVTIDPKKQVDIEIKIDKLIWDSMYGLPLFQSVGVDAYNSDRIEGVKFMPNQTGVWWNFWDWKVKS